MTAAKVGLLGVGASVNESPQMAAAKVGSLAAGASANESPQMTAALAIRSAAKAFRDWGRGDGR